MTTKVLEPDFVIGPEEPTIDSPRPRENGQAALLLWALQNRMPLREEDQRTVDDAIEQAIEAACQNGATGPLWRGPDGSAIFFTKPIP
ncbi:MAG: hypothetical protein ACYTFG_16350 [Planctomycetota bacterium]|jgi:hypothetical protein